MISSLTNSEVAARTQQGLVNFDQPKITKTTGQILVDNICTVFNLFNVLIGLALALVGAWTNMAYLVVIAINCSIGIIQELRARALINRLSLLDEQSVTVVRGDAPVEISSHSIVLGDTLLLRAGQQIPVDAVVLDGRIEVNESLLTGEADSIVKSEGETLLSGSFVVSGQAYVRAERVGRDSFAATLALQARRHRKLNSRLIRSMRQVTRLTSVLIVPIGLVLLAQALLRGADTQGAVVSAAAALLGMLPKGLVLLISIALVTGILRLARRRILVQELYSLENLARADVLCLDKTGTLTTGKMRVSQVTELDTSILPVPFLHLMGAFVAASEDNNATYEALREHFVAQNDLDVVTTVPFASERKYSAVNFAQHGALVIGAPEVLCRLVPDSVTARLALARRVLAVAWASQHIGENGLGELSVVAYIELSDTIRTDAGRALEFFRAQGIDVKVISGDNPLTVSSAAVLAGMDGAAPVVDMMTVPDTDIARVAGEYTIFGRVTPQQKAALIRALRKDGHTVAMVGDGVNDVLALREADCGIAMAAGSDAAKQISQLVLVDSDFVSIPAAINEGRRVINNVTKVSGVFFVKTLYSIILSMLLMVLNMPFPFIPIQITLIDLAIEGYPAFFLSFEPNHQRMRHNFLAVAVRTALPNAVLIVLNICAMMILGRVMQISPDQILTLTYLLTGFVSVLAVWRACLPPNPLRLWLGASTFVGFFVAVWLFADILHLQMLILSSLPLLGVMLACNVLGVLALGWATGRLWSRAFGQFD